MLAGHDRALRRAEPDEHGVLGAPALPRELWGYGLLGWVVESQIKVSPLSSVRLQTHLSDVDQPTRRHVRGARVPDVRVVLPHDGLGVGACVWRVVMVTLKEFA